MPRPAGQTATPADMTQGPDLALELPGGLDGVES